jgi:hypothetical protein
MASIAYGDAYSSLSSSSSRGTPSYNANGSRRNAVDVARRVERRSIETAELSVQELIDCDTRYDQGCAGGNPLLAYYFLRRYGVTSARNYPYTGKMDTCRYRKVDEPVATVKSWGILTADHENNIEKVRCSVRVTNIVRGVGQSSYFFFIDTSAISDIGDLLCMHHRPPPLHRSSPPTPHTTARHQTATPYRYCDTLVRSRSD